MQGADDLRDAAAAGGAQFAFGHPGQQTEHYGCDDQRNPGAVGEHQLEQVVGPVAGLGEHDRGQRHHDRADPQGKAPFPLMRCKKFVPE
jgi:hypothetical protein